MERFQKKMGDCTYDFINDSVEERLSNPSTLESNDFVGLFLKEIKTTKDPSSCFYGDIGKQNLVGTLVDIFVASTETCSTTLSWMFLYLALNSEKQEELIKEIDRVLGRDTPKLEDASRMPYAEAVIMETMRLASVVPMNLFHCALQDTKLDDSQGNLNVS
ncbi:unnamed protein product [Allacma fusca]|uniref:Cytochrome P450 n=1 Tax=Allacma fusca TaxID=39272 RepID=A0A8J2P1A8_9HEXA|nr:unnamed protein product [Allacma fusca]